MVNILRRAPAFLAIVVACSSPVLGVPSYTLGDRATNDVIATARLVVEDESATAEIRSREAAKVPFFMVCGTNHAAFIESEVRLSLTRMREDFLDTLQGIYGTHQLLPEVIQSEGLRDTVEAFLSTSPGPPVPGDLPYRWAEGTADEAFLEEWFEPLRQVLAFPVVPDGTVDEASWPAAPGLRLVPVNDLQLFVKAPYAWSNHTEVVVTDLVPLSVAREEMRQAYGPTRPEVVRFMVDQLRPNSRFDTNLTERVKQFRVSGLVQMTVIEPGAMVVRTGQVIDEAALAALAEMRRQARILDLEKQAAVDQVAVQLLNERNLWLAGLLACALLSLVLVMIRARRRQSRELVLSSSFVHEGAGEEEWSQATVVDAPSAEQTDWRQRALEAERHAAQAKALARSNLMPHLAQQLRENVVQQLSAQMDDMLEVQAAVAEQMAALESRLERMHAPLQERLRIYEQRIAELEAELGQRGQENEVLLRARIDALRRQMEREKAGTPAN